MQPVFVLAAVKQLSAHARSAHLPISFWIKSHPYIAGAAAIVLLPLGLLGALALCTFALTLPIAYVMSL